jgi:hypothetical protein
MTKVKMVFLAKQRYRFVMDKDELRKHRSTNKLEYPDLCWNKKNYDQWYDDWEKLPWLPRVLQDVIVFKYGIPPKHKRHLCN